tara:strand:- start:21626 stop:22339 length:714 start_codon:yes stop_codon:yes gene_type:complete
MDKNLVTRNRFAGLAGVQQSSIQKAINSGKLAEAFDGKKIDLSHPQAKAYLEKHSKPKVDADEISSTVVVNPSGVESSGRKGKLNNLKAAAGSNDESEFDIEGMEYVPEQIRKLSDWPLKKLVKRFGNVASFIDWLKATKIIEDIETARLKNGKAAGDLVTRDLIVRGVIDPIETAHIKMITDGAKNIANRVHSMAIAGKEVEECERYARETLQSFIRPMKAKVARTIKQEMEDFED